MMRSEAYRTAAVALVLVTVSVFSMPGSSSRAMPPRKPSTGQEGVQPITGRSVGAGPQSEVFFTSVPERTFDVILNRPTGRSVGASVLAYDDMDGYLEYGLTQASDTDRTPIVRLRKGEPGQIVLEPLESDMRYFYRLRHRPAGTSEFAAGAVRAFHTQRSRGAPFNFAVQTDSHLDENASADIYKVTLANALAGGPDFYIDLGDTFMTDKRRKGQILNL